MVIKNVILNVFSCSSQAPCNKWATEFFSDPPLIINVAGSGSAVWRAKVNQWAKTGDLFLAAVKENFPKLTDIEIGKRGLTTFSAGWNFADELFKYDNEINKLDAYLLLENDARAVPPREVPDGALGVRRRKGHLDHAAASGHPSRWLRILHGLLRLRDGIPAVGAGRGAASCEAGSQASTHPASRYNGSRRRFRICLQACHPTPAPSHHRSSR